MTSVMTIYDQMLVFSHGASAWLLIPAVSCGYALNCGKFVFNTFVWKSV